MFNKILLVYKEGLSKNGFKILERIKNILTNKELTILRYNDFNKNQLKDEELVITLGGDGTFVRAGNLIENSLILGINHDAKVSEGFLMSLQGDEISLLKEIIDGKYQVKVWPRAKVILNGKQLEENAINEVFVGISSPYESARYVLNYRGKKEEQRSSGVIVATGAGSSAWYKSAGGKEFLHEEQKLKFIVREPYFGKKLFKPTILQGEILPGEKLVIESRRSHNGVVSINEAIYDFNYGNVVEILLSEKPLKVLFPKK